MFASLLSRDADGKLRIPLRLPGSGCQASVGGWVGQEEDQSRALGAGRTLSIKSPCKSPFLSSAPALLTPTNSWGSINSPVEKERERERKSGALGPEWDWRAVWGSRRVRVMRWTRQTPSQCPLSSCCIANTLQNGRVLKEHLVLYLQAAQQQQSRWWNPPFNQFNVPTNFLFCSDW